MLRRIEVNHHHYDADFDRYRTVAAALRSQVRRDPHIRGAALAFVMTTLTLASGLAVFAAAPSILI